MTIDKVPARGADFTAGIASVVVLLLTAALTVPIIGTPWGVRPWMQAVYLTAVILLEFLIALFLALDAVAGSPNRALRWLAAGYAFTGTTAAMQFFAFPGILDAPLAHDRAGAEQLAPWLWVIWHAAFPCFVVVAMVSEARGAGRPRRPFKPAFASVAPVLGSIAAALALALGLAQAPASLPVLMDEADYRPTLTKLVGPVLVFLAVYALFVVVYLTRLRGVLHLWLAIALVAFTLDILLSLAGQERYSAGWYMGRVLSLSAAGALVVALVVESFSMHHEAEIRAAFHEQEALHDPLTGLFNRRHLMNRLAEEWTRAVRHGYPVSLLMLDLDHFKTINDTRGHRIGDECLSALGRLLSERVHRSGDVTARYGGEEFVVLLPETGLAGAIEVAEQVRLRVETLFARGLAPCPMTVSIGVASSDAAPLATSGDLLACADGYLYQAKQLGRNRVVSATPVRSEAHDLLGKIAD